MKNPSEEIYSKSICDCILGVNRVNSGRIAYCLHNIIAYSGWKSPYPCLVWRPSEGKLVRISR